MSRPSTAVFARQILTLLALIGLASAGNAQSVPDGAGPPPLPLGTSPPPRPSQAQAAPAKPKKPAPAQSKAPTPAAPSPAPVGSEAPRPSIDFTNCLAPTELEDNDGDVQRNLVALSAVDICIKQDVFNEGGLRWVLQIIQNKVNPNTVFWIVPHDNEHAAFDSAVYGLRKYGGTIVAVETGGKRFNGPQDPNRNFDAGTGLKCREQVAPSPLYTSHVMRWRAPGAPIMALHTNEPGYAGDGKGGAGEISMAKPLPGALPFPSAGSIGAKSPDDTMVFVASTAGPENDSNLLQFVKQLNQQGINVQYELVSTVHNDCSMSNYAALKGIRDYLSVEVVDGDGATQRRIVDIVLEALPEGGIGPPGKPAAPGAMPPTTGQAPGVPAPKGAQAVNQRGTDPHDDEDALPTRPQSPASRPGAVQSASRRPPGETPPGGVTSRPGAVAPGPQILLQISSAASEEDAAVAWQGKYMQFEDILRQYQPMFKPATLPNKGTVYRVLLGPFASEKDAGHLCDSLKDAAARKHVGGMDCFVSRN